MTLQRFLLVLLLASCVGPTILAADDQQLALPRAFEVVALRAEAGPAPSRLQIQAFGRDFGLELSRNEGLLTTLPTRQRSRIPAEDLFLRGALDGVPGSWVRLNRIDGRFSGGFFDGDELYLIDHADAFAGTRAAGVPAGRTIVFRFGDLDFPALIDHGAIDPAGAIDSTGDSQTKSASYGDFVEHLREVAVLQGSAMMAIPVTIVSDVRFTGRHGPSTASVVAGRINFIDGIYSSQLGTGITLLHHEILTDNDVLTSTDASDLLNEFRGFMTSGAGSEIPFEGLAHLFTRDRPQGGTVGIAYLGVLCSQSFGYGLDEDLNSDTTSALVFAHEVGHNFSARHDDNADQCPEGTIAGIMNSRINGSEQFSDCSLDAMSTAVGSASCLVEVTPSDGIFADSFEP